MENINLADSSTLDAIKFELNAEGQKRAKGASFEEGAEYYDLFIGGYLDPSKMLDDPEQIQIIRAAMRIVNKYISAVEAFAEEE
jgi:hypothetical protein